MLTKFNLIKQTVIILVILFSCNGLNNIMLRRNNPVNDVWDNSLHMDNGTRNKTGRGFFFTGGLLSLGKVLNFFPVGGERECQPAGYNVAKAGICLNQYDCRQRDGRAAGDCAQGLGVCCVFEVTCSATVQNNLTYFMSPGFPELWSGQEDCTITIEKTHAGITQLRVDFVHFTIGQPNRTTGECDEDAMILGDGDSKFVICGQNHGQHIYYNLGSGSERREAGELAGAAATTLTVRMRGGEAPRLWLLRLAQLPLAYTAPHDCLQYFTADNGTIRTFNYASNGRHLAGQQYRACVRRSAGVCAVRYWPCDARAFRIGPPSDQPNVIDPVDVSSGEEGETGPSTYGPDGSFVPSTTTSTTSTVQPETLGQANVTLNETMPDQMMPADMPSQDDVIEGSGADPQVASSPPAQPGIMARIWGYLTSWVWEQRGRAWSPYLQHYDEDKFRYFGYGNYGVGLQGYGRQRCKDRVTIPCENEYFVSSSYFGAGVCDPHHCGNTFCPGVPYHQCHVDTSITPFAVTVHFGPPTPKRSPEENIGMCLRYTQVPCNA